MHYVRPNTPASCKDIEIRKLEIATKIKLFFFVYLITLSTDVLDKVEYISSWVDEGEKT